MFSSLQPTKKYFVIMFLISCVLLEVFTFVIYQQSRVSKHATDTIIRDYEVMRIGRLVMLDSIDLANSEQSFILTNHFATPRSYEDIRASLDKNIYELSWAAMDNPDQEVQLSNLRGKIEALERISGHHLQQIRSHNVTAYSLKTYQLETQAAVTDLRHTYQDFIQNLGNILEKRMTAAKTERNNYLWTLAMGGILGLGALLIANIVILSLISRNARSEEKYRKSEELFAKVLDGINDGVYDYDIKAGTMYYSPSYQKMLGYSEKELSANHEEFARYIHPDDVDQAREVIRQYLAREIPTFYNIFRVRHKDGHWVWIMSRGIGIWDDEGNIQRLIGTHTDISTQKQHEEELNFFIQENERQQAELAAAKEKAETANQAKSDFLAMVSHEIRTPMNAVIGLSGLLLKGNLNPKHYKMVETLHTNADTLLQLVNDLLDISRIEAGQIEIETHTLNFESIFKVLHALFDNQASAKGVTLSITNNLGKKQYVGDATRIQQILVNLVNNALKFTESGTITVVADGTERPDGTMDAIVHVTDTGVGIASDKLDAIFEKFVQADQTISRRFGGSGLGLAICKSLAALMGGDITVSSRLNRGSTFTFMVPLRPCKAKEKPQAETLTLTHEPASGTVLVVEDYAANVMVATLMLETLGYTADVANNGKEALAKIKARSTPYTAILMDVQMQGMNGYETTQHLRTLEQEKGMRHYIIGVTAHALAGDRDRCLAAGMDDYMSKPIHFDILAQKLSMLEQAA